MASRPKNLKKISNIWKTLFFYIVNRASCLRQTRDNTYRREVSAFARSVPEGTQNTLKSCCPHDIAHTHIEELKVRVLRAPPTTAHSHRVLLWLPFTGKQMKAACLCTPQLSLYMCAMCNVHPPTLASGSQLSHTSEPRVNRVVSTLWTRGCKRRESFSFFQYHL